MGNPDYSLQKNIKENKKKKVSSPCLHPSGLGSVLLQVAKVSQLLKWQDQVFLVNLVVTEVFRPSDRGDQEP